MFFSTTFHLWQVGPHFFFKDLYLFVVYIFLLTLQMVAELDGIQTLLDTIVQLDVVSAILSDLFLWMIRCEI